ANHNGVEALCHVVVLQAGAWTTTPCWACPTTFETTVHSRSGRVTPSAGSRPRAAPTPTCLRRLPRSALRTRLGRGLRGGSRRVRGRRRSCANRRRSRRGGQRTLRAPRCSVLPTVVGRGR